MRHAILTSFSTLLLVVALVFLVLATISTPVAKGLHLAASLSFTYGILGYCDGSDCSSATYPILFGDIQSDADWFLGTSIRNTLGKTFIVAPIAAGLAFLAALFTFLSLFLRASALKILSLIFAVLAFVSSALIAVMIVLVFHPNVEWLGWLVVAAAACCLVAVPLLLFSITARKTNDDTDSEDVQEQKFGDISKMDTKTSFSAPSFNDGPKNQYGYTAAQASGSGDFNYRGAATNYAPPDPADTLSKSLLEATPNVASDMTRQQPYMASGPLLGSHATLQNAYSGPRLQSGPSTPIAPNRHLAPEFVSTAGTAVEVEQPAAGVPYPHQDRASSIYTLRNYGVFDHHPSVEGHQPFTELQDTDETAERNSLDIPIDSDGESDFTSVSQRPPNETYSTPQGQFSPRLAQAQGYQPNVQFQAYPPGQGPYYPRNNLFGSQHPPSVQMRSNQAHAQPSYDRFQHQYQTGAPRPMNRPTVSDNVLNNNPDFAIGFAGKRKQAGRAGFAQRPNLGASPGFAARGQRDGPYSNI